MLQIPLWKREQTLQKCEITLSFYTDRVTTTSNTCRARETLEELMGNMNLVTRSQKSKKDDGDDTNNGKNLSTDHPR